MGNTSAHAQQHREFDPQTSSQFSLSNLLGGSSGRSLLSVGSNQTVCSAQRPWSRVSRRRWCNSTLNSPLGASKTAWPVPRVEALFLPEFPVTTELAQRDFSVEQTVAKGAFGEVYRVHRASDNKEYALKVLAKAQVVSENAVRQVKEEVKIQEACGHHSFIVGAVSRWQTKKRLYILSEYVSGGELLALLDKYRRLPEDLVRVYVAELALALAPEVLRREPYGHAVDWWSLGVVACRMLTDQYPTPAVDAVAAAAGGAGEAGDDACSAKPPAAQAGALPHGAASLSGGARTLLGRLLDAEPRRRLRSVRDLQRTAFYMGFNFDDVRTMKTSPKTLLEELFPPSPSPKGAGDADYSEGLRAASQLMFADFDHVTIV